MKLNLIAFVILLMSAQAHATRDLAIICNSADQKIHFRAWNLPIFESFVGGIQLNTTPPNLYLNTLFDIERDEGTVVKYRVANDGTTFAVLNGSLRHSFFSLNIKGFKRIDDGSEFPSRLSLLSVPSSLVMNSDDKFEFQADLVFDRWIRGRDEAVLSCSGSFE